MRFSFFLTFITAGILVSHTDAHSAERCGISVGDRVAFHDPAQVYGQMQGMRLVKDEFETTAAFERRVAEARQTFNKPILLRGIYSREHTNYDADNSRIVMQRYAWDNLGFGWDDVFGYNNSYGIEAGLSNNHATALKSNERVIGTFVGSNAYGASVEVTQISRISYGVFDRKSNSYREETWRNEIRVLNDQDKELQRKYEEWGMEFEIRKTFGRPAVLIPMSVDEAKRIISKLQVGILVRPKKPFVAEGERYWGAKIDRPEEIKANYRVIVADMICAVIADDGGRVLKTVPTAY